MNRRYMRPGDSLTDDMSVVDMSGALKGSDLEFAMSVDVEEHFQVAAFDGVVGRGEWDSIPSRVVRNTERSLEIFSRHRCKATFFVLGCVAEKWPGLLRSIVKDGHELASHGYDHRRVSSQSKREFLEDVSKTKKILEDISGVSIVGYRAPSFSIGTTTPWAHDVLEEAGYVYSSSTYPISHDHYGAPSAPRFPFRNRSGGVLEIPLATAQIGTKHLPAAGGGYFRLLPYAYSRWSLKRIYSRDRMPAAFYFHPWEIDPDQPRFAGLTARSRFRHYVNLGRFESRLDKVLGAFSWNRMDRVYRKAIEGS